MALSLREIRNKIRKGDFSSLFSRTSNIPQPPMHASDKARILENMPEEEHLASFAALGEEGIEVFPYLEEPFQKELLDKLPREQAAYILNNLNSDDRTSLFSEM